MQLCMANAIDVSFTNEVKMSQGSVSHGKIHGKLV